MPPEPTQGSKTMPLARLQQGDERLDDALRREVFAAALALRRGELTNEVFVDESDQVLAAMVLLEDFLGEKPNQPAHILGVELEPA
jgi:hypothetical protein